MYIVSVSVFVKEGHVDAFVEATLKNARCTRQESGNVRFDVARTTEDPCRFLLYEVYRQEDDFVSHQQTEHYLQWRTTVADMMAQPRQGVKHESIFFGDE